MSQGPNDSPIRVDAALEAKIQKATTASEIAELLKDAAVAQNLAVRDWDETILHATSLAEQPQAAQVAKVVNLNGVKHSLVGKDEADLLRQESALYRAALEKPAAAAVEQPRGADGRFVEAGKTEEEQAAETARLAGLQSRFQLGLIDAATYIKESGAIDQCLAENGVSIEDLKEATQTKQDTHFQQSWEKASEAFKNSTEGCDWIGGEANLKMMNDLLVANPDLMENPSVESLVAVWNYMKENNKVARNPEIDYKRELSVATTATEIDAANAKYFGGRGPSGGGFFGR